MNCLRFATHTEATGGLEAWRLGDLEAWRLVGFKCRDWRLGGFAHSAGPSLEDWRLAGMENWRFGGLDRLGKAWTDLEAWRTGAKGSLGWKMGAWGLENWSLGSPGQPGHAHVQARALFLSNIVLPCRREHYF